MRTHDVRDVPLTRDELTHLGHQCGASNINARSVVRLHMRRTKKFFDVFGLAFDSRTVRPRYHLHTRLGPYFSTGLVLQFTMAKPVNIRLPTPFHDGRRLAFTIADVFSKDECAKLIEFAEAKRFAHALVNM